MRKKSLFFVVFILIFLCGDLSSAWAFFGQIETKKERRLREELHSGVPAVRYEAIQESFLREDYSAVEKLSENYLSGSDRSKADEVSYLQALSLLKLSRVSEARSKLNEVAGSAHSAELRSQAAVSIGDSYYLQNDFSKAYQNYEVALKKFPGTDEAPFVQGRLAELSKKLGTPSAYVGSKPVLLHQVVVEESSFYTVQVGSFSKERNARVLMHRLTHQKYDAHLESHFPDRMFRVRVGKLSTREDAAALENHLKKDGYPTQIYP